MDITSDEVEDANRILTNHYTKKDLLTLYVRLYEIQPDQMSIAALRIAILQHWFGVKACNHWLTTK